ncbi:MAG: hypothetical protein SGBAC_006133 [Bacillariaceae sp.]
MPRSANTSSAAAKKRRQSKRLSAAGSSKTANNISSFVASSESKSTSKSVRKTRSSKPARVVESSTNNAHKTSSSRSSSSSSSSSSSIETTSPPPLSQRLRKRKSTNDDRKLPATSASMISTTRSKRGGSTIALTTDASGNSSNKRKKTTRLTVNTKTNAGKASTSFSSSSSSSSTSEEEHDDPAVSRQTKKATQVTPSPHANSNFEFESPHRQRSTPASPSVLPFPPASHLPAGVLDLYPKKKAASSSSATSKAASKATSKAACCQNDCSADSLSASYIQSYGQEYWNLLKSTEKPTIADPCPPSPHSFSSKSGTSVGSPTKSTTPASSQSSSNPSPFGSKTSGDSSSSDLLSSSTPNNRRDYVYVDSCNLEVTQPTESNLYLSYQPELSPKMRAILVDWIIELSEHFHFGPASLHLAITLVDKVMACGPLTKIYDDDECDKSNISDSLDDGESKTNCFFISRDRFQLLGAACTWLACKMEELSPPSVSEIAYVSDNIYSTEQIKRMERRICNALNFSLLHQTPHLYTTEFIRASYECADASIMPKASPVFYHTVMYFMELCRLPYFPVTQKPSLLAAAAVYGARVTLGVQSSDRTLDPQGRWSPTLQHYTGYSKADLRETVLLLHSYHQAAEDSSLKSVFAKYRTKKYLRVAVKTVPRVQDLGF